MTQRQRDKHIADRAAAAAVPATYPIASSLVGAEPTPDELGTWEGGRLELKGANNWVELKSRPTRTGDSKHAHGNNSHLGPNPLPPDAFCITAEDGNCASKDPRCMHNQPAALKIEESDNIPCSEDTDGLPSSPQAGPEQG